MAKAPVPGLAKTRLIPDIGAHAAAVLAARLTERAVQTARAADVGPVTLWCMPDTMHPDFRQLARYDQLTLARSPQAILARACWRARSRARRW